MELNGLPTLLQSESNLGADRQPTTKPQGNPLGRSADGDGSDDYLFKKPYPVEDRRNGKKVTIAFQNIQKPPAAMMTTSQTQASEKDGEAGLPQKNEEPADASRNFGEDDASLAPGTSTTTGTFPKSEDPKDHAVHCSYYRWGVLHKNSLLTDENVSEHLMGVEKKKRRSPEAAKARVDDLLSNGVVRDYLDGQRELYQSMKPRMLNLCKCQPAQPFDITRIRKQDIAPAASSSGDKQQLKSTEVSTLGKATFSLSESESDSDDDDVEDKMEVEEEQPLFQSGHAEVPENKEVGSPETFNMPYTPESNRSTDEHLETTTSQVIPEDSSQKNSILFENLGIDLSDEDSESEEQQAEETPQWRPSSRNESSIPSSPPEPTEAASESEVSGNDMLSVHDILDYDYDELDI